MHASKCGRRAARHQQLRRDPRHRRRALLSAIRDACALLRAPLVEVHISNIHAREEFRHHSVVSAVATGVIAGLGVNGYRLALEHVARFAG